MRRIRHGKYLLTAEQAEQELARMGKLVQERSDIILAARAALKVMLYQHQPYVSGAVDVSISDPATMKAALVDKIKGNLWCTACGNPWPCRRIEPLRKLRDALRSGDFEGVETRLPPRDENGPKKSISTLL